MQGRGTKLYENLKDALEVRWIDQSRVEALEKELFKAMLMTLSINSLFCIVALRLKRSRIHDFDCFDKTGGVGLETIYCLS